MPQAQLSAGSTHYQLAGPEAGPLVVLLHGISMPLWNWDYMASALAQGGFRVLRYDAFGRGESAYPRRAYNRELLLTQLRELLDKLGITQPINLAGFSFGGALAASFTAACPERVRRLALIAPFARMELPDRRRLARLPGLGEVLMRFALRPELRRRAQRLLSSSGDVEGYARRFAVQVARPQFLRAFLSLMRTDGLDDYGEVYRKLAASGVRTALIWGAQDVDISRASIEYTRSLLQPAEYLEVEGADHGSIHQAPHRLDTVLASFFAG